MCKASLRVRRAEGQSKTCSRCKTGIIHSWRAVDECSRLGHHHHASHPPLLLSSFFFFFFINIITVYLLASPSYHILNNYSEDLSGVVNQSPIVVVWWRKEKFFLFCADWLTIGSIGMVDCSSFFFSIKFKFLYHRVCDEVEGGASTIPSTTNKYTNQPLLLQWWY